MTSAFRPFVLVARMASPIAMAEPIHLDGILYDVRYRRDPSLKGKPLDCLAHRDGIPQCSASILVGEGLAGVAYGTTTAVRAVTARDLARIATPKGSPSRIGHMSPYRNRMRDYQTLSGVDRMMWQVLGDPDAVLRMLDQVPGIGAMRSRGYGRVSSWEILECAADAGDVGWFAENRILRVLPLSIVDGRGVERPSNGVVGMPRPDTPFWREFDDVEMMAPSLRGAIMTGRDARRALSC